MKKHLFFFLALSLFTFHFSPLMASDWVKDESKYYAWHYTDHLYLEVFLADLDSKNTYCKEGTLRATNGSKTIDLLTLKYINEGDDEDQTAQVKAKLLMSNAKAWFTNYSSGGTSELTNSEKGYWLYKWGSDNHYMTAKIDLYYSASMAGGDWKIYFHFKHSNDDWYDKVLKYSIGTSTTLGLSEFNWKGYSVERTGLDKMTFTVPQLPNDIESKVSSVRMRKCTYYVQYTFYKQDGSKVEVNKTYEASTSQKKTEDCAIPGNVGNPKRIDCKVTATHGVKDPSNWFNWHQNSESKLNAFKVVPVPGGITTDFRQFDKKTVLTWTTPSSDSYLAVTPYIYRIETDESGNPKSGQSWNKRGNLNSTNGGSMSFTDDDVTIGTYFRYRVVNVPTNWIDHGISSSSLNSPSDDLLSKLGYATSNVVNTVPKVTIHSLVQDVAVTDKVRLTWQYTRVPTDDASVTFKVLRKTSDEGDWSEYSTVNGDADLAAGKTLAFEDGSLPNVSTRYQYKIRLELAGYRFESDVLKAGLLAGTQLTHFEATKGTHDASVTLRWSAKQAGTDNTTYLISRRYINSSGEFMSIHTENGANEHYSWEDNTVKPGYYYEYKIEAYDGGLLQNTLYTVGFCQARGTVSGSVHFGSGTAVPDTRLWLRPSDLDGSTVKGASQYICGFSEGITWKADDTELAKVFGRDKDFTVQFFVRPDAGLNEGAVLAYIPSIGTEELAGYSLPAGQYSMVTISRKGKQVSTQVDTAEVKVYTITPSAPSADRPFSLGGTTNPERIFKGNFAEVRVWDHALSEEEKKLYYDRTLNGREPGLVLYWPLDEGLDRYAFDTSYANDLPNGRHATIGNNIVPSTIVPAETQLARYGITNDKGEYLIRGIPFMGSGSGYTLVPEKGIHEFSPNVRSIFISPTSLTANNIDFEDVSSFPMTGHIYYAGTNVPAEGIQFYIDGIAVTADGKPQQTDENGYYAISVPIGEHYVEAKLTGHEIVGGGRFPIEGKYNFADRVQHDFIDSTLVNFVGRVAGATYNDTLPVGFGASKNNIGVATITLRLNNESFSFNCQNDYITPATKDRTFESDTASIKSHTWTGSGDPANTKYIYITTDSTTGEFSAKLPPLKYVIKSVEIKSNDAIEFGSLPEVDLTNPKQAMSDSIRQVTAQGDTVYNSYKYNTKKVISYFATPQVEVVEKDHPAGAFGLKSLIIPIDEKTNDTIHNLYTVDSEGVHNLLGYPIYQTLGGVEYAIHGFEAYVNKDGAKPVTDTVPLNGRELTITNEMSSTQGVIYQVPEDETRYQPGEIYELKQNQIQLDKNGRATLKWTVGLPNIADPYTRQFSITLKQENRTHEVFRMNTIVLGSLTNGNNFVTKGPDQVQFILRDPYGAHSKTTLKKGSISTKTKYYTYQRSGDHSLIVDWMGGANVTTATGWGVALITTSNVQTDITTGLKANWKYTHKEDSIFTTTTVESISTGAQYPYVGARGDVYVGTANNILVGTCRKLHVVKNVQTGKYQIQLDEALALGQKINTMFAYSQYELETVMIPKWKDQRKQYLKQVGSETEARNYQNKSEHVECVTWLSKDDPQCGDSGTYVFKQPVDTKFPKNTEIDSVQWCNNQIKAWEKCIRDNEEAKVKVMKNKTPQNYSIDGGSSRTLTFRNDITAIDQKQTDYTIQAVLAWKQGWEIKTLTSLGVQTNLTTNVGGGTVSGSGKDSTNYTEWEYVLADGNRDVDLSISMYDADSTSNSKIFSLFGGQTYNPYEPADSTHYYEPGTPLGNGSVQMEQPVVQIGVGTNAPGKSATITDIPAGGSATATLYCSNTSTAHAQLPFGYNVVVSELSDSTGLQILMDGNPINGRTIWMENGVRTQKVITVRQTDESILDHEGIKIRFQSQYQPLEIYDVVTLNAHFKPSSSPVTLTVTNPVINTDPTNGNGTLNLKVSGFNRQFKNLKNIGLQYRFAGNTQWTDIFTWVTDKKDSTGTSYRTLPPTGDLKLTLDMSNNISYPEGEYEFRAFTTTPYGKEQVQVFSETTKVIKDMTKPRPLFTPTPANGVLGIGEQLSVEFNEDIVPGYVGDKNIIISAKLNGSPIDHDVSLYLAPAMHEAKTVNPIFLSGNFSLECWVKMMMFGTVLHQGSGTSNFSLGFDEEGHAVIRIAGMTFVSTKTVPKNQWVYLAMNYNSSKMTFNLLAQYDTETVHLFTDENISLNEVQAIDYTDDNHLYVGGGFWGSIHDLALYSICRDVMEAAAKKYQSKDGYVYGLANYWPMNEGHGTVAADMRHTHDFIVSDKWSLSQYTYALALKNKSGAQADISLINTNAGDSYAIELWYKTTADTNEVVFETGLTETDRLCLHYDDAQNLVLDYKDKSQTIAAAEDFPGVTNIWRHLVFNVVRGQAASFYINGKRVAVIAESDIPRLQGDSIRLGKGGTPSIDELRIWHATLTEQRLLANMYHALDTADMYCRGLVAYYPFEKDSIVDGVKTLHFSVENKAPHAPKTLIGTDDKPLPDILTPPIKKAVQETRITAVPVSSERDVVINLAETEVNARDIEGTTLNITLAEVHDLHGNISNPIKWTAYVQQNTLDWKKDSVNIYKPYGADYTFDVDIENKSGQIEYYTIANMPEWLTLVGSLTSDEVQPLKTKTLRFAVNPLVPVNDYDVTIGLQGNKQILEPLRIVMKVRGEAPKWSVNPTLYDHSMTVIGQVYLGGILMENTESMVAAFIGGECRGVASPVKVRGAAYVTLQVYGHDTPRKDGDRSIDFRIWDASKGVAYMDALTSLGGKDTTVSFHDGALVGNFDYPVIWTKSDKVEQQLYIHENWNWITFGVEPESQSCDLLFRDYLGWNILLKDTGSYSQSNGSEWKGSLAPHANQMYKMKIARTPATQSAELDPQLAVRGQQQPLYEMPVTIEKGWNWMAYTPLTTKRIEPALAGANPKKGDIVKSQTTVAIYSGTTWEGTLTALEPGHGYLYFSTDSMTRSFTYPEDMYLPGGMMGAPMRNVKSQMSNLQWFNPVDKHNYPSNMTMTIRLLDGAAIVDTCEIGAFVGDECRGAVRADAEGLYYLVIVGEGAGQAMEIKTVLDGEIVTIDNTLTFTSDDHIGTPWEPYIIQLNPAEGIEEVQGNDGQGTKVRKEFRNGILYILRNGKTYTATGQRIE